MAWPRRAGAPNRILGISIALIGPGQEGEGLRRRFEYVFVSLAITAILVATPAAAGTMRLAWGSVSGALGYRVYYGNSSGSYTATVDVGNTTQATLSGLADCSTYFVAVKAYNNQGESNSFSNEIEGWARPTVDFVGTIAAVQGEQLTVTLSGMNFEPGAQLEFVGAPNYYDGVGNPLVLVESSSRLSCSSIQALLTVEATAPGFRAMKVGTFAADFTVRNPDQAMGDRSGFMNIHYNPQRSDLNRSDSATRDRVDGKDLIWLSQAYGNGEGQPLYNPDADLDGDGFVDGVDLAYLASDFGKCWDGSAMGVAACP